MKTKKNFNVRLVLAGGGNEDQSIVVDEFFLKLFDNSKQMLYIPIAIDLEGKHPPEACLRWIKNAFHRFDFSNIDMKVDLLEISETDLRRYGAVYIGGGNTFKLLREFRKTGFYTKLQRYIQDDIGPVYGGSAGAILMGKSIMTARLGDMIDEYVEGISEFQSYNFVQGNDIDCHYFEKHDSKVFEYVRNNRRGVISIPEESGLYVSDNRYRKIGRKEIYEFSENSKSEIR